MQKICGKLRKLFHTLWKSRLFVLLPVENLEYTLCNLWKTRSLCSITCGKVRTLALLPVENLSLPPRGKPLFIWVALAGARQSPTVLPWRKSGCNSDLYPFCTHRFFQICSFLLFFSLYLLVSPTFIIEPIYLILCSFDRNRTGKSGCGYVNASLDIQQNSDVKFLALFKREGVCRKRT